METYKIICLIVGVISFTIMLIYKLKHDITLRKKGIWIVHWSETFRVLVPMGTVCVSLFTLAAPFYWYTIPLSCILVMGPFWFFFDGFTSLSEYAGWWSTGGVDDNKKDSLPDRFLRLFPLWAQKIIKFIALLVPISVYVLTLLHGK